MTTLILIYAFFVFLYLGYRNYKDIHKFQQTSYRNDRYKRFLNSKNNKILKDSDKMMMISGVFAIVSAIFSNILIANVFLLLALATLWFSYFMFQFMENYQGTKKKLAITPRVKRLFVTVYLVDLILFGMCVFMRMIDISDKTLWLITVPILINIFSYMTVMIGATLNAPIEKRINQGYINDAKRILSENKNLIIIGITGSYGKTSVKNILHQMLSQKYSCLMTPESYNTTLGVVRTIREQLKPFHEVFIVEMGAREPGDIMEICQLVHPRHTIITSIGEQHLETFKNIETIIKTKGEIFEGVIENGAIYINLCDQNIAKTPRRSDVTSVTFGIEGSDLYPTHMKITGSGTQVTMMSKDHGSFELSTKMLGRHNIENITACVAIALNLGLTPNQINHALFDIAPVKHRLSLNKMPQGYTILDDAFNSNPVGSKNALEVLKLFDGNVKYIMTPGMVELGTRQDELNEQFGRYIAKSADQVILVGEKQTQPIYKGMMAEGYDPSHIYIAKNLKDAFDHVNAVIKNGDVLLIENDLPDIFNE